MEAKKSMGIAMRHPMRRMGRSKSKITTRIQALLFLGGVLGAEGTRGGAEGMTLEAGGRERGLGGLGVTTSRTPASISSTVYPCS